MANFDVFNYAKFGREKTIKEEIRKMVVLLPILNYHFFRTFFLSLKMGKEIALIIFLVAICQTLWAQNPSIDSANLKNVGMRADTLTKPIEKGIGKVDSLTLKVGTILRKGLQVKSPQLADSTKDGINNYSPKITVLESRLRHKIDSLEKLKLPTAHYTSLLDSLKRSGPVEYIGKAQENIHELEKKINSPLNKPGQRIKGAESKVNSKLDELNKEGLGLPASVNAPNLSGVPNLNLSTNVPELVMPTAPGLGAISQLPSPTTTIGTDGNALSNGIPGISNLPQNGLSQLENNGALGEVGKGLKAEGEISSKAKTYIKEVKGASKGDMEQAKALTKDLESRAENMGPIKELKANDQLMGQYKGMMAKGANPEELEQMATDQIKKGAVNHFAGKEQVLEGAMASITKYRLKYPNATEVGKAFKGVRNEMRGKPFRERFVPGFNLQFQSAGDIKVDINPTLGYRISGKWAAGIGWLDRAQFHRYNVTVPEGRVYGLRAYNDVKWKKGFAFRAEAEHINQYVTDDQSGGGRQWAWDFFAGVKKDYRFTKKVRGNIQALYNIGHYIHNTSAYGDKLNVRMGFEISPIKK